MQPPPTPLRRAAWLAPALLLGTASAARADGGWILTQRLDSATAHGPLTADGDEFGTAVASLGDLDGDGTQEVAIGAPFDIQSGSHHGVVHIVSLDPHGISEKNVLIQGVAQDSTDHAQFGRSLANVGDLDGDGIDELAVGEFFDLWVLFLNADGSVRKAVENVGNDLGIGSFQFSFSLAGAGDIDGDGVRDLVAGDPYWSEPGDDQIGCLWVLFLEESGKVAGVERITEGQGILGLALNDEDHFGWSVANAGDRDGDGRDEIAVGAPGDDAGAPDTGAVYLLTMNASGTVQSHRLLANGGLDQGLSSNSRFGTSLAGLGDFDGSGGPDLVVGSPEGGRLWKLFLDLDGSVLTSLVYEGDDLPLHQPADAFGAAVTALGDLDGNGFVELVVGAPKADGGGAERGAVFTLLPEGVGGAEVAPLGCGINPAGSLFVDTLPRLGASVELRFENPFFNDMNPGASTLVMADVDPLGCGFLVPGAHLDETAPAGELYLLPPFDHLKFADVWEGPSGNPTETSIPIPFKTGLLGVEVYVQGLFYDPTGGFTMSNFFGLTEGHVLTIGT